MTEELKPKEESAPLTEDKPSYAELKRQRLAYMDMRKKEVEVLELDTRFLELQVKHYDLTRRVKEINDEIKALKDSKEFKDKILEPTLV
jgi:hypothetical protein